MNLQIQGDVNCEQLLERANKLQFEGDYIKALEIIEDLYFVQGNHRHFINTLLGNILKKLADKTEKTDVKVAYMLATVECFSIASDLSTFAAMSLFRLAHKIGSVVYYKKYMRKANEALHTSASVPEQDKKVLKTMIGIAEPIIVESKTRVSSSVKKCEEKFRESRESEETRKSDSDLVKRLKTIIGIAEERIAESKTRVASSVKKCEEKFRESREIEEIRKSDSDLVKRLRLYWADLNVEIKRNFMKLSIAELTNFVEGIYGTEGRGALEQVLTYAREYRKWRLWMCRTCSKKFSSPEECKNHLEDEHGAKNRPNSTKRMPKRISKVWARKISVEGWEPLDAAAALEMIKNRFEDVKAFAYENGWSKDWPLAADEERSKLLKEIQLLLVSFWELKILCCSIRDRVMHFPVKHFEKLEVSKQTLTDCHLVETPQSICFLDCGELNQILDFLKLIKCERDDGTDLVCGAVDSFCSGTRVKEKIDFDSQFSFLFLDKRLLQCKIARFDDDGTVNVFDPNVHYAKAHAHGDDIVSWLTEHSSGDESFQFPTAIRAHNLDIWVAVLKSIQFTCRTLGLKYLKKWQLVDYDAALTDIEKLCISEDEKRTNLLEDQWTRYESLLCDRCEEHLRIGTTNSFTTNVFLCAVRDVFKGESFPTFNFLDCGNVIRERKNLSDDLVLKSIDLLKLVVTNKVAQIDSKMLLIEKSRINLLNDLTRLSVFDYRSYILRPIKELMLDGIISMETKAKVAEIEAEAGLSFEKKQEEKKLPSKKNKNKSKKRNSTSMSSPHDKNKTVEHKHSVNLELDSTSLKKAEEDTVSSERGQTSSNTNNQEEATKDIQNLPGEYLLSEHLESAHGEAATIYNSALDITLKALLNIKVLQEDLMQNRQLIHGNLEEHVPGALQDFFSAVVSEQIKEGGLYSYLLSNFLASLEEVHSLSSDAAEVVVAIFEFWHCWKSPERESLVTRLFTLEEYERMSCRKCRRKPNYPEQSSYGIVVAADSIRDLKRGFGNIKFEDILKVIRLEDEMICDVKTGCSGKTNFIHHTLTRCSPIFTIVFEWEKNETEKEISETTNALDWEIDINKLYKGLEPNTKYRLVSMVGCGEEGKYICMAYTKNRWISLKHESLAEEGVGNWNSLVRFCRERKVRPEILFYEAARSMA